MRRNHVRTIVSIALLVIMASGLFAAGRSEDARTTSAPARDASAPTYLQDTSPVTFDWYVDASWYTRVRWGQDFTSQYITRKTGVNLNLIIPAGNEAEKKNLMIASGDLPDFVSMGWWEPQAIQLEQSGLIWSLNELADQFAPDFWDETSDSVVSWYTREDGRIYGYPNVTEPPERVAQIDDLALVNSYLGFMVRKDIWEAIGAPDMTTPEQFLDALARAKEMYPTVGGQPLIPLGMGEFTATGNLALDDQLARLLNVQKGVNGEFNDIKTDPEYVRWLRTLRVANERRLLSTDIFIDKDPQIQDKIKQGRYFALIYARNSVAQSFNPVLYQENPDSIYITIDGPRNSRMEQTQLPVGSLNGWLITYISRQTRHPERAIRFIQYLLSEEGQLDFFLGDPEHTREILADGTQRLRPEISALRDTDEVGFSRTYGARDAYFFLLDPVITSAYEPERPTWDMATRTWYRGLRPIDVMEYEFSLAPDTPEGTAWTDSQHKWGTTLPRLLLAKTDAEFDQLLREYEQHDARNREIYTPAVNRAIAANLQRLGRAW
jgi:putative aldouronate transport system substrate-binding protein